MPIVAAAVAPHGFPIIPDISEHADGALKTREAMLEMGRRFNEANVEVIFITGPHGIRVNGFLTLADTYRAAGMLRYEGNTVELNMPVALDLSDRIFERAIEAGIPVAQVGYGGSNRMQSTYPADWGILTPLWFAGWNQNMPMMGDALADLLLGLPEDVTGPEIVVVNTSRIVSREDHVAFGRVVAEVCQDDPRRIGFIASCDWAHRHDADHPNGFHPDAPRMDAMVSDAIRDNDPISLINLDDEFIRNAAIDGLWQLLMLAGAMDVVPMNVDFLSYEAPTYYGMIVAGYEPVS